MSSSLTRRGPRANEPARLPGIETSRIADHNARQAVEALREWVEVRLGSRGDVFERAVTRRDFARDLAKFKREIDAQLAAMPVASGSGTASGAPSAGSADLEALRTTVTALSATVTNLIAAVDANSSAITQINLELDEDDAGVGPTLQPLALFPDGAGGFVVEPDAGVADAFIVTMTDDAELQPPIGMVEGGAYTLIVRQDATGARVLSFASGYVFPEGAPVVRSAADAVTVLRFVAHIDADNDDLLLSLHPGPLNASSLNTGIVPDGRFPAVLPAVSGENLTDLDASALASGTVPDGRFPATLPALSGANLTALNATELTSGTVPDARLPANLRWYEAVLAAEAPRTTTTLADVLVLTDVAPAAFVGLLEYEINLPCTADSGSDAIEFLIDDSDARFSAPRHETVAWDAGAVRVEEDFNTASPLVALAATDVNGWFRARGCLRVASGASAASLAVQHRQVTAGETTFLAGGYLRARLRPDPA